MLTMLILQFEHFQCMFHNARRMYCLDRVYILLIDFDNSNETLPSTSLLLLSAGFVTQFSTIKFYNGSIIIRTTNPGLLLYLLPKQFSSNEGAEVNCVMSIGVNKRGGFSDFHSHCG